MPSSGLPSATARALIAVPAEENARFSTAEGGEMILAPNSTSLTRPFLWRSYFRIGV
jgi:hypothetical protein